MQSTNSVLWDIDQAKADESCAISSEERVKAETQAYSLLIKTLRAHGTKLRSDQDQPNILQKPRWFNETLFYNAKSVYERHFMGINFAHLSGLLLLVRVDSIYKTLSSTGESDSVSKLFKRYYHTVRHVKAWYEGDIFKENSEAYRSLLIVRGMHNKVSSKFNGTNETNEINGNNWTTGTNEINGNNWTNGINGANGVNGTNRSGELVEHGVHISEYDIMITQFAFIGFIVIRSKNMGLLADFSRHDLESLLHFWRTIGYYLGASEKFNLCSYELRDIIGLCEAISEIEYKDSLVKNTLSAPQGIMSLNIIRAVKFIPMLTIYGMLRYLYEILDQPIEEIEHKKNWYSNLSYTLINLVMTRILAYKPMRSFNNGLTRLSLFLIGKIDDWFANHLDYKYRHGLHA